MIRKSKKSVEAAIETPVVIETPTVETPTVETPVEAKAAKVRYAKRDWAPSSIITLVAPNGKSGKSKARYDLYRSGMTVAEYADAVKAGGHGGKTLANADLRWDVARGFITIAAPES